MKKIMLAVCLMFGGATLVSAQEQPDQTTETQSPISQDQDRQQISASELPDAVSAKLESQDFAGWTVGNVYKKMDESQNEVYIIEMKQGTETKKVKFDKDGNKLDKAMHEDKADNQYRDNEDATLEDASEEDADNTQLEQDQ